MNEKKDIVSSTAEPSNMNTDQQQRFVESEQNIEMDNQQQQSVVVDENESPSAAVPQQQQFLKRKAKLAIVNGRPVIVKQLGNNKMQIIGRIRMMPGISPLEMWGKNTKTNKIKGIYRQPHKPYKYINIYALRMN